ncbi:MAG: hypothetical protein JST64_00850 [Actinobacteria bacterium]|nr:hypothetical protein [Actinomycetota bacterium]
MSDDERKVKPNPILCSYLNKRDRTIVGLALYAMSHLLGDMDSEQVAAFGTSLAVKSAGHGLMSFDELYGMPPDEALSLFGDRAAALNDMRRQIDGGP